MHETPSVNSFYADILRENRPSWPKCTREKISHVTGADCRCATHGPKPKTGIYAIENITRRIY